MFACFYKDFSLFYPFVLIPLACCHLVAHPVGPRYACFILYIPLRLAMR
jgi:hypothetical protein